MRKYLDGDGLRPRDYSRAWKYINGHCYTVPCSRTRTMNVRHKETRHLSIAASPRFFSLEFFAY